MGLIAIGALIAIGVGALIGDAGAPSSGGEAEKADAEGTLSGFVPVSLRSGCTKAEVTGDRDLLQYDQAGAALRCRLEGADALLYYAYTNRRSMLQEHNINVSEVSGEGACRKGVPGKETWRYPSDDDSFVRGRLLCYRSGGDSGQATLEWTNDDDKVYGIVTRGDGDVRRLYRVWAGARGGDPDA